jgi:hypothetical protein
VKNHPTSFYRRRIYCQKTAGPAKTAADAADIADILANFSDFWCRNIKPLSAMVYAMGQSNRPDHKVNNGKGLYNSARVAGTRG